MQLNFYRISSANAQILFDQMLNVFFYDSNEKLRSLVEATTFEDQLEKAKDGGHFQILVQDIKFVLDEEMVLEIAHNNKETLHYIDRHKLRLETYAPFYSKEWHALVELSNAFKTNDFKKLLGLIQADLANDMQDISTFATTVSDCLEKVLRRDSNLSRMICFSYCNFKHLKYKDRALLFDFLGAIILKDLGLTQNRDGAMLEKNDIFFKHPYYSLFLIKKLPIELSQRCYFFILDHHESNDGSGFPRQKTAAFYHPLCDTLKVSENLFLTCATSNEYQKCMKNMLNHNHIINTSLIECLRITCSYLAS